MRQGLSLVQTQFEDIVREIDGGLDHLQWRGNIIPKPHFTDTVSFSVIAHSSYCLLLFKNDIMSQRLCLKVSLSLLFKIFR